MKDNFVQFLCTLIPNYIYNFPSAAVIPRTSLNCWEPCPYTVLWEQQISKDFDWSRDLSCQLNLHEVF